MAQGAKFTGCLLESDRYFTLKVVCKHLDSTCWVKPFSIVFLRRQLLHSWKPMIVDRFLRGDYDDAFVAIVRLKERLEYL